jgi:hypothetical protein
METNWSDTCIATKNSYRKTSEREALGKGKKNGGIGELKRMEKEREGKRKKKQKRREGIGGEGEMTRRKYRRRGRG